MNTRPSAIIQRASNCRPKQDADDHHRGHRGDPEGYIASPEQRGHRSRTAGIVPEASARALRAVTQSPATDLRIGRGETSRVRETGDATWERCSGGAVLLGACQGGRCRVSYLGGNRKTARRAHALWLARSAVPQEARHNASIDGEGLWIGGYDGADGYTWRSTLPRRGACCSRHDAGGETLGRSPAF